MSSLLSTSRSFVKPSVLPDDAEHKRGNGSGSGNGHKHRIRTHIYKGQCRAAVQAVTAARAYLGGLPWAPTIAVAALYHGSTPNYVVAAIVILRSKDEHALNLVLQGRWALLEAAAKLKPRVRLIEAFDHASPADRAALGRMRSVTAIWDEVIMPALT
jgi:hypothetical protein